MIDKKTSHAIVATTEALWQVECQSKAFLDAFQGKERGHRIADLVEEVTVRHLEQHFDVKHEMSRGKRKPRSMGDMWLACGGIYNPVNVKAGVYGIKGQPNLVSLAKLTQALLDRAIDSYYLLFVKFTDSDPPVADVELVNLLGHLEFVHFNSGPGQMMLRADRFMGRERSDVLIDAPSVEVSVDSLLTMRRAGNKSLVHIRATKLAALEKKVKAFDPTIQIDQTKLHLG